MFHRIHYYNFFHQNKFVQWTSVASNGTIIALRDNIMSNHISKFSGEKRKPERIIPDRKAK